MQLIRNLLVAALLCFGDQAFAAQGTGCMPTTGIVSGLSFSQNVNAAIAAIISSNSGAASPATDCSALPIKGQVWLDTSVTPNIFKMYDGVSTWVAIGALDATNHQWVPPVGGGLGSVTAAGTTDLCASPAAAQTVLGTTTITSFGSTCIPGIRKTLIFNAATPLTYNATSLIIPGQISYTTVAGDVAELIYLGGGNWRIIDITKIDGSSVTNPAIPVGTALLGDWGTVPAKTVYGAGQALSRASFPQYVTAVTRTQTATLTSGNATITSVPNTQGLGVGMPIEGAGIPASTTILSVTSTTIVLSANATTNGTQTHSTFLTGYGSGGNSTTVGVKDCRGRAIAGRDDLNGSPSGRLTSTYFGAQNLQINGVGGLENFPIATGNMPSHNHPVFLNDPGHFHSGHAFSAGAGTVGGGGAFGADISANTGTSSTGMTVRDTTGGGGTANQTALTGGGTPIRTVQPTVLAECVVVVLP